MARSMMINPVKVFRKYAVKKNMGKYNIWHYCDTKAEFETAKEYYKKDKQVQFFVFENNLLYIRFCKILEAAQHF